MGGEAELQVHGVQSIDETSATVVVRCIRGPVRLRARFRRIRDAEVSIDLEVTRILCYGRPVDTLDVVYSALVTLRGTGTGELRSASHVGGRQVIQGSNPVR